MSSWFTNAFSEEVWRTKYAGEFTDVKEYYRSLASLVAQSPKEEKDFFDLMWRKRFSPGGRILAFGGRPNSKMSLMNCTTHAIQEDSLEGISDAAYKIMRASSRGQGIGIDLSKLRPRGAPVNNASMTSTGAISFMEMLNQVGATIGQEGRRAALLFSLHIDHDDLWREDGYDFLNVKKISGKVENANISVLMTDEFMQNLTQGEPEAGEKFYEIAKAAWESAEPGLLMWDISKSFSNSDLFGFPIVGVNACTEQILDQEGVCNLGSMNLFAYVKNPFTPQAFFDFDSFAVDVRTAVRFLDNVLDVELEAEGSISDKQAMSIRALRRIGLGVMGLADALAALGYIYGEFDPATELIQEVFTALRDEAYRESIHLGQEKSRAPVWNRPGVNVKEIVKQGFFRTLPQELRQQIVEANGTRNITLLSVAPTGSISNLLGVSSGVEPLFALEYTRRTRIHGEDQFIDYIHPQVQISRDLGIEDDLWRTSYEVTPEEHVYIQALCQQYVDQSISKTVNLPKTATVEDVAEIYVKAWELGIKGITVYRDGSREQQVLYTTDSARETCPVCENGIIHRDGCKECVSCSWSICEV